MYNNFVLRYVLLPYSPPFWFKAYRIIWCIVNYICTNICMTLTQVWSSCSIFLIRCSLLQIGSGYVSGSCQWMGSACWSHQQDNSPALEGWYLFQNVVKLSIKSLLQVVHMVISSVIRYYIVIYPSSSAFLLGLQHTLFFLLLLSHHSIKQSLWLIPEVSETGQTFRTMVDFALIHCATA